MRKMLCCLLALGLLMPLSALSEQPVAEPLSDTTVLEDTIGLQRDTQLVIGSPTQMSGYFATDLWGTNSADMDVRSLIHGYTTFAVAKGGSMTPDGTVMRDLETTENQDGTLTYTFTIADGLMYSDETPINAKDYVFSLLLCSSPEVRELGGMPRGLEFLVGYDDYRNGSGKLSGVRLLNPNQFSLTFISEYRQYFYGVSLMSVTPYPISVIAPGCGVRDDGEGAYIAAEQSAGEYATDEGYTPGAFSAEMLRMTLLDPINGYVFNPRVTSGPYQLVSYDPNLHEARFRVNEHYLGNYQGQKPHIENLVFKQTSNENIAEELRSGDLGLVNKLTDVGVLDATLSMTQDGQLAKYDYPRNGFAFLAFACDQGPTASVSVRRAIAHCLDRGAILDQAVGANRAIPVYGYYGMGQWMMDIPMLNEVTGEPLQPAQALEECAVKADLGETQKLLEIDGWTKNERGETFQPNVDKVRYKEENGQLVPLMIRWAKSAGSSAADLIENGLKKPFEQMGIGFEVVSMPFSEVLREYYNPNKHEYNLFYMGSNFSYLFDPYYDYSIAPEHQGLLNASGLKDERMVELAEDLRRTDPNDLDGYMSKWVAFQKYWVTQMPMVPLWSNVYSDLCRSDLKGYDIALHSSWAEAIVYAYFDSAS